MVYEGGYSGKGKRFALVCARFNELIVNKLLSGARDALLRHETAEEDIDVIWVPGAFEIPLAALKAAESGRYHAVVALGAVIRGATPHFDYVCAEAAKGTAAVGLKCGLPVIFGVLTTNSIAEAVERAGTKSGNKGFDAAMSALEMANLADVLK